MAPSISSAEQQAPGKGIAELLEGLSALLAGPVDAATFEATRAQLAQQVSALQGQFKAPLAPAAKAAPRQASLDPGLPGKEDARAVLEAAVESHDRVYAAPIWVERTQLVITRYGQSVAEQVMQVCSQQIISRMLRADDQLFYWSGAGLLAVVKRDDDLPATRSELMRVLATPVNQYFETEHRTIYLPIRMSGDLFAVTGTPENVEEQIEKYFGARA